MSGAFKTLRIWCCGIAIIPLTRWGLAGHYVHQFGEFLVYSGPGGNRIAPSVVKFPRFPIRLKAVFSGYESAI
jgi:hypothetical protein